MRVILQLGPLGPEMVSAAAVDHPNLLVPGLHRRKAFLPYIASAGFHIALVSAGVAVSGLFPAPPQIAQPEHRWKLTMMRLQNRVFLPISTADQKDLADRAQKQSEDKSAVGESHPPKLALKHKAPSSKQLEAILIQPQFPMDVPPPPASPPVPSVLVWTEEAPRQSRRREVQPGPSSANLPAVERTARIEEQRPAPRRVEMPESPPRTSLEREQLNEAKSAEERQAVQLLSLSKAPVSDSILVPPGNLMPTPGGNPVSPGGTGGERSSSLGRAGGKTNSDDPVHESTKAAPVPQGQASSKEATAGERGLTPAPPPSGMEHPANGHFDIVVIQTSLDESLPSGLLHGTPVYTVYLQVGDAKEWTMHYCTTEKGASQTGALIQLPDPRPLSAPYPRLTFLPAEPVAGSGPYVLIRGILDESGSFKNLQVIGATGSGSSSLLETLRKWKFNPANRAGLPASVEMVLAIPVSKS